MSAQSLRPVFQYISQRLRKNKPASTARYTATMGVNSGCAATSSNPTNETASCTISGHSLTRSFLDWSLACGWVSVLFSASLRWVDLFQAARAEMSLAAALISAASANTPSPILVMSSATILTLAARLIEIKAELNQRKPGA